MFQCDSAVDPVEPRDHPGEGHQRNVVAELKKRFHKASQLSEKISGAEGTKLDEEFLDIEKKIDITTKAVAEILQKPQSILSPIQHTKLS